LFLAITLLGVRVWLAEAISPSLKHSFAVGIGLFLALIGLYETGIVTSGAAGMPPAALTAPGGLLRAPDVPLRIGELRDPRVLLAVLGLLLIVALLQRRVRGALLLGMAATAVIGVLAGHGEAPTAVAAMPFTGELSLPPLFLKLDAAGVLQLAFLPALLTLVIMGLLDTLGTLMGLGAAGGLLDEKGRFPEIQKPMAVDALTCVAAGLVGTTTSGAYIESATGIREGARTGLAAVTTASLFAASLFFVPLLAPLQQLHYVYAPALIAVGFLMTASARHIRLRRPDRAGSRPRDDRDDGVHLQHRQRAHRGPAALPAAEARRGPGARGEGRRLGARRHLPLLLPLRRLALSVLQPWS
jgi:AGZA family xanthine/uracil permease-like MFS transporter